MIGINLSGRTILITGALGAIAEHMVRRLAEAGATLALTDVKADDEAKQLLSVWGIPPSSYYYFSADITDSSQVNRVVDAAFERSPGLDTVIGHAGGCGLHPFASTSEADFERIFRFNFFAQTYLARAVLAEWMRRKIAGHLIFTSSYVARMPHTQISSYAAAKAALENFARSLALEYALTGIRVNLVSPGRRVAPTLSYIWLTTSRRARPTRGTTSPPAPSTSHGASPAIPKNFGRFKNSRLCELRLKIPG